MMRAKTWAEIAVVYALALVALPSAFAANAPGRDRVLQAPELTPAGPGSLAGTLAGKQWGTGDVSRGSLNLPFPAMIPEGRGPLLAEILPNYSPDHGMSEWGQGWANTLAISRFRSVGDLGFDDDDELVSPWGRLVRATDGAWYPAGLRQFVRVTKAVDDWLAVTSDGTRFVFSKDVAIKGPRGVAAWYLTRIDDVAGHHTELFYQQQISHRPYLTQVLYGGRGGVYTQRLTLAYDPVDRPIVRFEAGMSVKVARRVKQMAVESLNVQANLWQERFRYDLSYLSDETGQAAFLHKVTKTYASGASEPPVRFDYALWNEQIERARPAPSEKLQAYLSLALEDPSKGSLDPRRVTFFDVDGDGRTDIENGYDHTLVTQANDGWSQEPTIAADNVDRRCLPAPSQLNAGRTLARLIPGSPETHVFVAQYENIEQTRLLACTRTGRLLWEGVVDGLWTLGTTRRLVDANRDHAPDLVWVGRGQYRVLVNKNSPGAIEFGETRSGRLQPAIEPDAAWVQDVNGDGLADLIALTPTGLLVWHGLGDFSFNEQAQNLPLKGAFGSFLLNPADEIYFLDANHDGMTDVLVLFDGRRPLLFVNDGSALQLRRIPALDALSRQALGGVAFGNFSGSENLEVVGQSGMRAETLALDSANTGLLTGVDDGRGTRWSLSYDRAPAEPGIWYRPPVLAAVRVETGGREIEETAFTYRGAITHTGSHQLAGFSHVAMRRGFLEEAAVYHHDDDMSGLLLQSSQSAPRASELVQTSRHEYSLDVYLGLPFQRLNTSRSAMADARSDESMESTEQITRWLNPWCPVETTRQTRRGTLFVQREVAQVAGLAGLPHCLVRRENRQGHHANSFLDFAHSVELDRDSVGNVTEVRVPGVVPIILQRLAYDEHNRVARIDAPYQGTTQFAYDEHSGQLIDVANPDGTRLRAETRDPMTDALLELILERGSGPVHRQRFRFDTMERLNGRWDSESGLGADTPVEELLYRFSGSDSPGVIASDLRLTTRAKRQTTTIIGGDGQPIAVAARGPNGWALGGYSRSWPCEARSEIYRRRAIGGAGTISDELFVTFDSLYAAGVPLKAIESDGLGHIIAERQLVQQSVQGEQRYSYEVRDGQLHVAIRDALGRLVRSVIDSDGQLVSLTDGGGKVTTFIFDMAGRAHGVTLPDGTRHEVIYDVFGRVVSVLHDGVARLAYVYRDGTEQLSRLEIADKLGHAVRSVAYEYDDIGRKKFEIYSSQSGDAQAFQFFYDGDLPDGSHVDGQHGHLTGVAGPRFTKVLTYAPNGKLQRKMLDVAGWRRLDSTYEYFADSNPRATATAVRDGSREIIKLDVAHELDEFGRPSAYVVNGTPLYRLHYDNRGDVYGASWDNGGGAVFARDPQTLRVDGIEVDDPAWPGVAKFAWLRDQRGSIVEELLDFDLLHQARHYSLDARNFLSTWSSNGQTEDLLYDAGGLPITPHSKTPLTWDTDGHLCRRGAKRYSYNAAGHLASVSDTWRTVEYLYDESGQRLLKSVDGLPVRAFLDGDSIDASRLIRPVEADGWRIGSLVNGQFRPALADGRGTVIVDGAGRLSWPSPYGEPGNDTDGEDDERAFAGHAYDADTHLVRMGIRDYDPQLRRYTSPDPLYLRDPTLCVSDPLQCTLFAYANNDPLTFVDDTGLSPRDIWGQCSTSGQYDTAFRYEGAERGRSESPQQWAVRAGEAGGVESSVVQPLDLIALGQFGWHASKAIAMQAHRLFNVGVSQAALEAVVGANTRIHSFEGIKEASAYLQGMGVARLDRVKILQANLAETVTMEIAGPQTYGIRFFGGPARPIGSWLTPTFGQATNSAGLALPAEFNTMAGIRSWQVVEGTAYIRGIAAPQLKYGAQYVGGAEQWYVHQPWLTKSLR